MAKVGTVKRVVKAAIKRASAHAIEPMAADMATADALKSYKAKRNFSITSEPAEGGEANVKARSFVIQKHWATRLHYDFRLELDGTMKSWAVPKGPSFDPKDKRMAVHVEDHPISYNSFEGTIPPKQYGAGKVIIWDKGTWIPLGDARQAYRDGNLKFELRGHKLHGKWALIRMKNYGERQEAWLLIKEKDDYVRSASEYSVVDELPDSVARSKGASIKPDAKPVSGKTVSQVALQEDAKNTGATSRSKPKKIVAMPNGAVEAALPESLQPQLATLVDAPPADAENWLYEIKFDGYRMLARVDGKRVQLITRNGNDWTAKLPELVKALTQMKLPSGWFDGEIIVPNAKGLPDFQALQNAFEHASHKQGTKAIVYYLFDVPFYDGHDVRGVPLSERRRLLKALFERSVPDAIRYSDTFEAPGGDVVASACRIGLEGVIGKRKTSTYAARRSNDWIKLKCVKRQEFVIGGYTDPQGARTGLGSLLLGVHDEQGKLQYAGNVGSGFNQASLADVKHALDAVASGTSPFANKTGIERKAHWVEPTLLAEVSFSEWTQGGHVRHGVFHGLRSDKKAIAITRDKPVPIESLPSPQPSPADAGEGAKTNARVESPLPHQRERARGSKGFQAARGEPPNTRALASAQTTPEGRAGFKTSESKQFPHEEKAAKRPAPSILPPTLKVTHPERVIDASTGITKIELIRFYALVGPLMMPHLKARPVSLVRAPDGIGGQLFFQKHIERAQMAGIASLDQALDPDHPPYLEVAKPEGLLSAAQMNVVEFHTWNAVKTAIDQPDRMTFDLDPGEGVAWTAMQEATLLMRNFLNQLGLVSFVKTSGGKGMHVVVPFKRQYDWDMVKDFSHAIVLHLAKTLPQRFVALSGPRNRVGKIFIDYLRNGFGATTVAAWSARSRPGMGVSVPLAWDEVESLHSSAQWHVGNIHTRLDQGNAPWDTYAATKQSLKTAMKTLDYAPKI